MRPLTCLLAVLFALAALLAGCGSTPPEELTKIKTWAEVQDLVNAGGKTKVVVWVRNTSNKTFSGTIEVRSYDPNGKSLGFDAFYPKNLAPGKKAYGITWLKVSNPPRIETKASSGTFK